MNNEKEITKQELIKEIADYIWNHFAVSTGESTDIAEALVDKYTIKEKQAYNIICTLSKTIYADSREEAVAIYDHLSIDDMGSDGKWEFEDA